MLLTASQKRMWRRYDRLLFKRRSNKQYGILHSDIDALERVEILRDLRTAEFDVLVGVNLLREGLDLPEVSLIAILDADKEGFLRSEKSLMQTAGRTARNAEGLVIFYADKITNSMRAVMDETLRRRDGFKMLYNEEHGIVPQTISNPVEEILQSTHCGCFAQTASSHINMRQWKNAKANA